MTGTVEVIVTDDKMNAGIIFYECDEDDEEKEKKIIDFDTVMNVLKKNKIVFGINEDVIKKAIEDNSYYEYLAVAKGKQPVDGIDAEIEYKVNLETSMKPKLNENGNVDYRNVDNFISVKQGEVLAVYIPLVKAINGSDVFGHTLRGKEARNKRIPAGTNTEILSDKVTLVSKIDGLVQLINDKIFVFPLLTIEGDVDTSVGNVDFIGAVRVYGNVCSGMRIKAVGSVSVGGMVEAAEIYAGGDVIINGGIKGMEKAVISSGGSLVSKYIESAVVRAKADITTNAVIQANIQTDGKIIVIGTNGSIIGGLVKSMQAIICKKLGSRSYIPTTAEICVPPVTKDDMAELKESIAANKSLLSQLNKTLYSGIRTSTDSQKKAYKEMKQKALDVEYEISVLEEKYERCKNALKSNLNASISIVEYVYPDVTVIINGTEQKLVDRSREITFFAKNGNMYTKKCEVLDY
ncbi:MAG: DUF342 domain-containing protein [Oscillospiraceae bacterium]|nr:DUF342 domain-containing protein [Oscillospiraceae bacterium]